jgi:hypothetical protein
MELKMTFADLKVYARPWTISMDIVLMPYHQFRLDRLRVDQEINSTLGHASLLSVLADSPVYLVVDAQG